MANLDKCAPFYKRFAKGPNGEITVRIATRNCQTQLLGDYGQFVTVIGLLEFQHELTLMHTRFTTLTKNCRFISPFLWRDWHDRRRQISEQAVFGTFYQRDVVNKTKLSTVSPGLSQYLDSCHLETIYLCHKCTTGPTAEYMSYDMD
ncbi:hypothetical protein CBL_07266 [Carabus blaptoides fortunei]